MSEDFLKNPLSLFDVNGKTAIVTGAIRRVRRARRQGAGRRRRQCRDRRRQGGRTRRRSRPNARRSAARSRASRCGRTRKPTATRWSTRRSTAFGSVDILVVASGKNKVAKIVDQTLDDFLDVMDANVTQSWLMARAAGRQMLKQGARRQDRADVVGARPARPSGRLHRLLRLEVGGRRHHQGARLRMGRRPASPSMRSRRPYSARR